MKENRLTIQINKPVNEGFAFALNPQNTPKWLDSIVVEETNGWPIRIGSVYRNRNCQGEWSEYIVTAFKENQMFELMAKDGNYHVRYVYRPIDDYSFTLEYYEWVDKGEIEKPFTLVVLHKLKSILEKNNEEML